MREVQLGLAADVGTLQRLPAVVGHSSEVRCRATISFMNEKELVERLEVKCAPRV